MKSSEFGAHSGSCFDFELMVQQIFLNVKSLHGTAGGYRETKMNQIPIGPRRIRHLIAARRHLLITFTQGGATGF